MEEQRSADDRREEPRVPVSGRRAADCSQAKKLEATECHSCGKLLCENTRNAIRAGQIVAIKCGRCNAMNYLMGASDVEEVA